MIRVNLVKATGASVGLNVEDGTTVGKLVSGQGINFSNSIVRVNRQDAAEDQVLGNGDIITVTQRDMKGADEVDALQTKTYESIVNFGAGKLAINDGVIGEVLKEEFEAACKAQKAVVADVLGMMRADSGSLNREIEATEKRLADLNKQRAEANYALSQLLKPDVYNVFSAIAYLGLKGDASHYCARMGCSVPDAKSDVWKTSAE